MTATELDAILARADAATPGPWRSMRSGNQYRVVGASRIEEIPRPWSPHGHLDKAHEANVSRFLDCDADFIAAAREDVPSLVAEVRRLEKDRATDRATCDRWAAERDAQQSRAERAERERDEARDDLFHARQALLTEGQARDVASAEAARLGSALTLLRGSCDPFNGNVPQWCGTCGGAMESVRPGKAQCRWCEDHEHVQAEAARLGAAVRAVGEIVQFAGEHSGLCATQIGPRVGSCDCAVGIVRNAIAGGTTALDAALTRRWEAGIEAAFAVAVAAIEDGRRLADEGATLGAQRFVKALDALRARLLAGLLEPMRAYIPHTEQDGEVCTEDCEGCRDPIKAVVKRLNDAEAECFRRGEKIKKEREVRDGLVRVLREAREVTACVHDGCFSDAFPMHHPECSCARIDAALKATEEK